jgi:hypothetical protein
MTQGDKNLQTSNENQSRVADALTYNPLAGSNGHMMKTYYAADEGFTDKNLIDEIFPGASDTTDTTPAGGSGSQTSDSGDGKSA